MMARGHEEHPGSGTMTPAASDWLAAFDKSGNAIPKANVNCAAFHKLHAVTPTNKITKKQCVGQVQDGQIEKTNRRLPRREPAIL